MGGFREIFEIPARLFAIGDIHGCCSELDVLLSYLTGPEKLSTDDIVVFIGDFIDRGPGSKDVIERVVQFCSAYPRTVCLRGNHEEMFMDYLGIGGSHRDVYLQNGGEETLRSYEVMLADPPEVALERVPESHIAFLKGLLRYAIIGGYVFAHAGLNPLRDIRAQIDDDLFWIRDEFINNIHHFGHTVVFGHTPYEDVLVHLPFKVGIDTGVVYGNCLSCVELTGRQLFQVPAEGSKVRSRALES